jgi:hypothetical protein
MIDPDVELATALNLIAEQFGASIAELSPEAQMSIVTKLFADLTMQFAEPGKRDGFLQHLVSEARGMIEP